MAIKALKIELSIDQNKKLWNAYTLFNKLLVELKKKELPEEIINFINQEIEQINVTEEEKKTLKKQIRKSQSSILKRIEKDLKLVTKNHYRNIWLAIGMAVFGIPLGSALGTSIGNMGLIGVGIPLGMLFGMAIGSGMDKKALEAGRQLDLEIY